MTSLTERDEGSKRKSDLALPHYDTRDVTAITDLPYMVVSHDLGNALSQLENAR